MERVGITHHLGYVSPVFDVARNLLSVLIRDGQGHDRREATLETADPFLRAKKIEDLGVNVVVCGAISRVYEAALRRKGIKVISLVCGPIEDVLSAYLDGTLGDLGRPLGVDLVPFETCSFDCIYCQLGRTTRKVVERREWVPLQGILEELHSRLAFEPDYIGSGEPTLYSRIAELIEEIHRRRRFRSQCSQTLLALGKGGSPPVRNADLVISSLDAGDKVLFTTINRPHPVITYERLLRTLPVPFPGEGWLSWQTFSRLQRR